VTVSGSNLNSVAEPRINLTVVIKWTENDTATWTNSSEVVICSDGLM